MSGLLGTAILETLVDLGGLDDGLDQAQGKSNSVFGGMANLAKGALTVALGVATAAVGAFAGGITFAIGEAIEAQEVEAQLNAVLKSTGGIAGVTAEMATDLAGSLSEVTRFGDEAILSGENMLLTFTNIGADVFPMATETMLDMSQAIGQDLQSSAVQLGKALNDPISGITALTRVGVTFTDEQKDMITAMVEAGDVAGAQTLILDELAREFGGSAEAAGSTFAGQLDILKNALSNVAEGIGTVLLPILTSLVGAFVDDVLPIIQEVGNTFSWFLNDVMTDPGVALDDLSEGIYSIGTMLGFSHDQMRSFIDGPIHDLYMWLWENIPAAIQNLSAFWTGTLQPALVLVWGWMTGTLFPALSDLWTWLSVNIPPAVQIVSDFFTNTLLPALMTYWAWEANVLIPALAELWTWLSINIPPALEMLAGFWTGTLQPALVTVWGWITGTLFPALSDLWDWLEPKLGAALTSLGNFWTGTLQPAIVTVWGWMTGTLFPALSDLWTWIEATLPVALQTLSDYWTGTLQPALEIVWGFVQDDLLPLFETLGEFFDVTFTLALTALAGLWENVLYPAIESVWMIVSESLKPAFDLLESVWTNTLKPALEKVTFLETLETVLGDIGQVIQDVIGWIQTLINKLLELELPDWLTPGSPTPFEMGLKGIANEMRNVILLQGRLAQGFIDNIDELTKEMTLLEKIGESLGIASQLSSIGGTFANLFEKQTLDPLKEQLGGLDKAIEDAQKALDTDGATREEMEKLNLLQQERADLARKIAEEEQRILEFQQKQQELDFLKAQMDLLNMVQEAGLDTNILAGLLGKDAKPEDLLDVMNDVIGAVIDKANNELMPLNAIPLGIPFEDGFGFSPTPTIRSASIAGGVLGGQATFPIGKSDGNNGGGVQIYNDFRGVSVRDQEQIEEWIEKALRKRGIRADEIRRIR